MGEKSKPAPFRVGDKVNLAKSTDVSVGTGVGVEPVTDVKEASSSQQEHLKKGRRTYRYTVTSMKEASKRKNKKDKPAFRYRVLDFIVSIYVGIFSLDFDMIEFLLVGMLILTVVNWFILSALLATFLGEGAGRFWATIILVAWTVIKIILPIVLYIIGTAFGDNEQIKEIAKKFDNLC